uniref:N-lysine methyltransferase KMT5A-like n=1 Tax=Scatophagus argus TaxID=75038 RepID=UPI001ED800E0|nr:N-lysine methyltransferase KMT5A-like [Scatophagus argus]
MIRYVMASRRRRRRPPLEDAVEHVVKALDKTAELEVKYINSYKGRGVFAKSHFSKGDFVVEYRGTLINLEESIKRKRTYHSSCAVFMFDFYWKEKTWCIDAAQEDGSLGRLVNDDHRHPNCKMKRVITEAKPYLCLFALRDIQPGEEITYDYGGNDWPWRKQVCHYLLSVSNVA